MAAFAGRSGASADGSRSAGSGAQQPKFPRIRRTTCGPSISAMTRIGPSHLRHSSGSASNRVSCKGVTNPFASLISLRPQRGRGPGVRARASSHVLTTLGISCGSAAPRRPLREPQIQSPAPHTAKAGDAGWEAGFLRALAPCAVLVPRHLAHEMFVAIRAGRERDQQSIKAMDRDAPMTSSADGTVPRVNSNETLNVLYCYTQARR